MIVIQKSEVSKKYMLYWVAKGGKEVQTIQRKVSMQDQKMWVFF